MSTILDYYRDYREGDLAVAVRAGEFHVVRFHRGFISEESLYTGTEKECRAFIARGEAEE